MNSFGVKNKMIVLESAMETTPLVSVLCLSYNHEKYLKKMIEGIVSQITDFPFEIIVHDDASVDSSQVILREAHQANDNLVLVLQSENQMSQGVSVVAEHLLTRARGKYIAFCEGDDFWSDKSKLQKQYAVMEKHPECDMCVHTVRCVWESGAVAGKTYPRRPFNSGMIEKPVLIDAIVSRCGYPFQTSSYFMRSSLLIDGGECKREVLDLVEAGDEGLVRIALAFGEVFYIDEEMSCYRQISQGSWSSQQLGSDAAIARCDRIDGVNRSFDLLTSGEFHDEVELGKETIELLRLIGVGDLKSAYKKKGTRSYLHLSKYQRIEVAFGHLHPWIRNAITMVRNIVFKIKSSK